MEKGVVHKKPKYILDLHDLSVEQQAQEVIKKYPLYYDEFKNWWLFDSEKLQWKKIDEVDIISSIKHSARTSGLSSSNNRTTLLNALKDEARLNKPLEVPDTCIQIGKNIIDISNNQETISTPEYICRFVIDRDISNINEKDECPFIDKLFGDWAKDEKENLYEILAFTISPKYFIDVCFWLIGSGENGKGLYQVIIKNVIGLNNVTTQDLELLSDPKDRFTKTFLFSKLMCSLGDGNHQEIKYSKAIKTLAGCTDTIRGEIKGGGQIDFYNTAKLIGAYNTLPDTFDKTMGFYRRQYVQEFKNDFSGLKNPLPDIPEKEYDILLYKSINKLIEIYQNNDLKGWGTKEERKEKYERLSNPIGIFIKENCVEDENKYSFGKTLYKEYTKYALLKGFNQFRYDEFEARLINQGFEKKRKDVYHYDGYCWGSIKNVPPELEIEVSRDKFYVFYGIDFDKNRQNRQNRQEKETGTLYESISSKKVSIPSKVSKNDKEKSKFEEEKDIIIRIVDITGQIDFVNALKYKNGEQIYNNLCESGDYFENPRGTLRKL